VVPVPTKMISRAQQLAERVDIAVPRGHRAAALMRQQEIDPPPLALQFAGLIEE